MEITKDEEAATAAARDGGGDQPRNPNSNPNPSSNPLHTTRGGSKGKSCTGYTYYSSLRKAKSKNPTCIGFSTKRQGPRGVGEAEARAYKLGHSLTNFKYACIGYSVYLDNKDSSADLQDKTTKLPFCVLGIEMFSSKKPSTSPVGHAPAPAPALKVEEHEHATPQPRSYKPPNPNTKTEEFLNRFQRNAGLVASGVAKNLNRVGNYVKETLDDMLNRRPK